MKTRIPALLEPDDWHLADMCINKVEWNRWCYFGARKSCCFVETTLLFRVRNSCKQQWFHREWLCTCRRLPADPLTWRQLFKKQGMHFFNYRKGTELLSWAFSLRKLWTVTNQSRGTRFSLRTWFRCLMAGYLREDLRISVWRTEYQLNIIGFKAA